MMKLRNLIFGGIVVMIICSCGKQQNDLMRQEASGNVKSICTIGYEAIERFGEISEGDVLNNNTLFVFNKERNFTELSCFDGDGNLEVKGVRVFDSDGKVTKINYYDGHGDEGLRDVYIYDDNGKLIKVIRYDRSGNVDYTVKTEWDGDEVAKRQTISEYADGSYSLDEYSGNALVKSVEYDKNGKPTGEYIEYDNGKLKKIVRKDFTMSLTYNDKGLCVSIINGCMRGSCAGMSVPEKGQSYTYDYEYDNKGNWIRRIERKKESQKVTTIFIREIEYY